MNVDRAGALGRELRARGATLATAESCTGGLVGALVTSAAGSSGYYAGGLVTYADEAKVALLGVEPELLVAHGAVSEPVALAMAEGARRSLGTAYAVSVTGIAGPGGGSAEKPVGLVFVAVAGPRGSRALRYLFDGDRDAVRAAAAGAAVDAVIDDVRRDGLRPAAGPT